MKFLTLFTICFSLQFSFAQSTHYSIALDTALIEVHPKVILENFRSNTLCFNAQIINASNINFNSDVDFNKVDFIKNIGIPENWILSFTKTKSSESFDFEKAGGNDCESAEALCSNSSFAANSNGAGIQELNGANQGCLYVEHQSTWYYMTVSTGGTLQMTIDPTNNSDDYDFAIWGPFTTATAGANCPPITTPIRCSYSANTNLTGMMAPYNGQTSSLGCGFLWLGPCYGSITSTNNPVDNSEDASGDSWVNQMNVSVGQVYIMLIDNFSNSGQPYNLSWGGTASLNCAPVILPVTMTDFKVVYENRTNKLTWSTASEINNDYFTVQRSTDGMTWQAIATIKGAGNSQSTLDYKYDDVSFANTSNYYKIVQTDINGATTDSDIYFIDNSLASKQIDKIVNTIGQEVDLTYKGLKIILFTDGTIIKQF